MRRRIEVREAQENALKDWLAVPRIVYRDDPTFVPRLDMLERQRVSKRKNPFLRKNEAAMFVAYRDGLPAGRISAQINRFSNSATGHFGFFDVVDDAAVARSLLGEAARWLIARNMRHVEGPFSFSINEESGLPIDGFYLPPAVMMPHGEPWQPVLLEQFGFRESKDLFAYRFKPRAMPKVFRWLAAKAKHDPRITLRDLNKSDFNADLAIIVDLFNDAWRDNWGFVPLTRDDLNAAIGDFRPLFRKNYVKFVCIDGKPEGFLFWVPNLAEIAASYDGKLFPLNWTRLLLTAARENFRSARMPFLGIRKEYQGRPRGAALFGALLHEWLTDIARYDLDWVEFSWVLDSNRALRTFLESAFGKPAKTYRIYRADLEELMSFTQD